MNVFFCGYTDQTFFYNMFYQEKVFLNGYIDGIFFCQHHAVYIKYIFFGILLNDFLFWEGSKRMLFFRFSQFTAPDD